MEQFSLEKWLQDKSRKIVTRNGKSVRIVCWDKLGDYPIIGCIKYSDDYEDFETYNIDGSKYSFNREDPNDLFFADEEEGLTELQTTLEEDCDCYVNLYNDGKTREELREWIKAWIPRITDLAIKEIRKEQQEKLGTLEMPIDVTEPYYIKGRQDALKDLPRWKKATEYKELEKHVAILENDRVILSNFLERGDYYIELEDLKTLPKEE